MKIEIEELLKENSYTLKYKETQLKVFGGILNNMGDPLVQAVIDWQGERDTSYCTDYYELPAKVLSKYAPSWDSYSSSGHHYMVGFISNSILALANHNKEEVKRIKLAKIEDLKRQVKELEQSNDFEEQGIKVKEILK